MTTRLGRIIRLRVIQRSGTALAAGAVLLIGIDGQSAAQSSSSDHISTKTVTVGDAREAWYADSPLDLCSLLRVACRAGAPAITSLYPPDTLHVALAGGREQARTYLQPDLSALPPGWSPIEGRLRLPVLTAPVDGTVSPAAARVEACLSKEPFPDGIQGSTVPPPEIDCSTHSTTVYDATTRTLTVDLEPFLEEWAAGTSDYGLVLLPQAAAPGGASSWQLTLAGRQLAGIHISSTITFSGPGPASTATGAIQAQGVTAEPFPSPATAGTAQWPDAQPPAQATSAVSAVSPSLAGTSASPSMAVTGGPGLSEPAASEAAIGEGSYRYPAVFLAPLALMAGGLFLAWLFRVDLARPTDGRAAEPGER